MDGILDSYFLSSISRREMLRLLAAHTQTHQFAAEQFPPGKDKQPMEWMASTIHNSFLPISRWKMSKLLSSAICADFFIVHHYPPFGISIALITLAQTLNTLRFKILGPSEFFHFYANSKLHTHHSRKCIVFYFVGL